MKEFIQSKFRRVTSNNSFIPEIDGLRFVAIVSVVLYHSWGSVVVKGGWSGYSGNIFTSIVSHGFQGVEIFFAISGFILCLPFANHYIHKKDKISLSKYFIRRVTRLEPPYFVAIIGMVLVLSLLGKTALSNELPHTLASLIYAHNFIFHQVNPILGGVTWSLEIEIQFYLLAPFLTRLFILPALIRRSIFVSFILFAPFYNSLFAYTTVVAYLQFFIVGLFLCDLYLTGFKLNLNFLFSNSLSIIVLFALFLLDNKQGTYFSYFYYPFLLLLFFYLILIEKSLPRLFSNNYVTLIGGMCYSIYLLHFPIIGLINDRVHSLFINTNLSIEYMGSLLIYIPLIMLISSVFYLVIEKPCMYKDWPQRLYQTLNKFFHS